MNSTAMESSTTRSKDGSNGAKGPIVLFLLYPEPSAFNASFTLARRLQERGFRIIYTGLGGLREHVNAQGFEYEVVASQDAPTLPERSVVMSLPVVGRWFKLRAQAKRGRDTSEALFARGEQYLQALLPAVVVLDPLIWRFSLLPLKCGIPIVSFSTALAGAFNLAVPPAFCDLQPFNPPGQRARLHHGLAWAKCLVPLWCGMLRSEFIVPWSLLLAPRRSSLARIRRAGGRIRWSEYGPRIDVPELVASPREFDFEAAAASGRIYVGSCVDVSRKDGTLDWTWLSPDKPLLYCSLGTYSHVYRHARRLFDAVLAALQRRDDLHAIVQVGTCAEPEVFGILPDRIKVVKRAPQLEILARAKIFVTHGGLSSVREAIYFGVPMLVFPCWNDQPGNAARVVGHGLGMKGDIATVDEATVTQMLERLTAPSFSLGMTRMQEVFRRKLDCQEGVEFMEALINGGRRQAVGGHSAAHSAYDFSS